MTEKIWRLVPVAAAMLALAGAAQAQSDSSFNISGFGTVGAVKTSTDMGTYKLLAQTRGATTKVSTDVDSKLGVQLSGKLNSTFSGTVQMLSAQDGDGTYAPEIEWGFVKAQISPALGARVGRMGGPFFAVSDFRHVGYANLWARPPIDVYNQVSFSHFDGADVTYQQSVGSATVSGTLLGGVSKANVGGTTVKLKNIAGVNLTAELDGGVSLRFGHVSTRLTVENSSLNGLVATLSKTPWASVGGELSAIDKKASFTGVGASLDRGDLVLSAEYTLRRTQSYVPDTTGWYVSAGYRFGKFTPYAVVSKIKLDSANVNNTIPAGLPGALAALKPTVDGLTASQNPAQDTAALGVRWDAYRNTAIKAQFDRVKPEHSGFFGGGANFNGATVNVYSLVVDFVF